ncbi:MAG: chromate efflux transporter [Alphaproteobacteria bacterium]|nr:chromate efflux transporter [Alphaproteobacteria bacterium]MBL6939548.1 chromate efflux transporter [Alphaproteobacteria bacterium]MBL7100078.1 chromate efflux transporter [Alphaproteobacteria bacterium]
MSGSAREVFAAFLKLGLTSFGGPIAHLGYFREAFVVRRRWLDESAFAELVSLCQFLPGPSSSQVGFAIGWLRAGPFGALAAWTAFTLPSALLMTAIALSATALHGGVTGGLVHGLKLVAVAVVAQAVFGMARTLTPDARRAGIALLAAGIVVFAGAFAGQIAAIAIGVALGLLLCREQSAAPSPAAVLNISRRAGLVAGVVFVAVLAGGPLLAVAAGDPALAHFNAFYRSGALVFGGGHVVLPLLQQAVVAPGWISQDSFLAGYGAAQALPGPLFTFAAYLGAALQQPPNGVAGAALALAAIFLPGILALIAVLPFWNWLRAHPAAQAAIAGANAAVVGILGAALYDPIWTSAVHSKRDALGAAIGFTLLTAFRAPPVVVVALGAAYGLLLSY